MYLSVHLGFDGNCLEAMRFYEEVFDEKIAMAMTWGESPMRDQVSEEFHDKIMHASIHLKNTLLMGADSPPGRYQKPQGIMVSAGVATPEEADRAFAALAEGGSIQMPIQETFWAYRFGMVTDRFGIPWMVNCEKPMPPES